MRISPIMMINDLSSVDKLVEFGMGVAIAEQMVGTMNHCIDQMKVPGSSRPLGATGSQATAPKCDYYAIIDEAQCGPLTEADVEQFVKLRRITPQILMWHTGAPGWTMAHQIAVVNKYFVLHQTE